jgi:crotonobetainyl-CoA:carnitine CoA-transferase CaiB-like acyl-CoA transferase
MTPYEGLRVADCTEGIAGAMACGLLAQFGADVVRVETAAADPLRANPGYLAWNCNKRRLLLDRGQPSDLAIVRDLVSSADVAVFDAAPGRLVRLGLDAASLTAADPGLIHAWLPMYGAAGRWSELEPHDSLLAAATCISFAQFSWCDAPVHLVTPQVSYGHGILAAGAIGAAIFERQRSGLGQSVLCSGVHGYGAVRTGGAISAPGMQRMGAGRGSRGGSPNYRLYQCADGEWLFLGTLTMPFFLRALEALDLLDLLALEGVEGELGNLQKPPANAEVITRLDARFAERPREEWLGILHANGVPTGPVGERNAWFAGEQVRANGMRVELHHPEYGSVSVPGVSAKLSETPGSIAGLMRDATVEEAIAPLANPWELLRLPLASAPGGPLEGVRILDLGNVIAGPFGPTVLANFGAHVIKVEPPDGDSFRTSALSFAGWNRGKRSVVLDLKSETGLETFKALVCAADVVVDNFRLGVPERLGIDHAHLAATNPRIITVSVLGYGPTGPFASDPGFDPILQARSGLMSAQGAGDEPVFHTIPVNDEASGLMSAFAIVTALNARERTGRGQHIWTSLANQSVVVQSGELTAYAGRPLAPLGGRDCAGVSALDGLYSCSDAWLAFVATGRFAAFAHVLGHAEWLDRWSPQAADEEPRAGILAGAIADVLAERSRAEALACLEGAEVPAVAAIRSEEAPTDPWLNENDFWESYDLPGFGTVSGVRSYAEFSRTPGGFTRPAPQLGQHTREVLGPLTGAATS